MSEYKRITFSGVDYMDKGMNRLKLLEDMIVSGRLVGLPCSIGDTVYRLYKVTKEIAERKVVAIRLSEKPTVFTCIPQDGDGIDCFNETEIGEYYFTDRAEAERRLAELK